MKFYEIRKSKIDNKGRGLYATKNIKEGTKIINYLGKIITNKEVEKSEKYDNKKTIYLLTLNKKYTQDGDFSYNISGLVNKDILIWNSTTSMWDVGSVSS